MRAAHRLAGVEDQVGEDLRQLARVAVDVGHLAEALVNLHAVLRLVS